MPLFYRRPRRASSTRNAEVVSSLYRVLPEFASLERFPIRWNRKQFHLIGNARTGDAC
jgi:hypothetical protein